MFKLIKLVTKAGKISISYFFVIVFIIFLWAFLSTESFNWNDFGLFMLIFTGCAVIFWAVFKILQMIASLGDEN